MGTAVGTARREEPRPENGAKSAAHPGRLGTNRAAANAARPHHRTATTHPNGEERGRGAREGGPWGKGQSAPGRQSAPEVLSWLQWLMAGQS